MWWRDIQLSKSRNDSLSNLQYLATSFRWNEFNSLYLNKTIWVKNQKANQKRRQETNHQKMWNRKNRNKIKVMPSLKNHSKKERKAPKEKKNQKPTILRILVYKNRMTLHLNQIFQCLNHLTRTLPLRRSMNRTQLFNLGCVLIIMSRTQTIVKSVSK